MHRFYLPSACKSDTLSLTGGEAHHALRVLRLQPGDAAVVLDGAGAELHCTVRETGRDRVQLDVVRKNLSRPRPCEIALLQAVPKGRIMEAIIQKATELGAARIVPLLSERVAMRLDGDSAGHKAEKWQSVAVEAIKQCGSAWLPKIESPMTPAEFLARKENFELPLIASLQPGSRSAREYFSAFRERHGRLPRSVCVWVGPEGDFTSAEVTAAQTSGALPISLGSLVLRVETAATYCLSILNHELT